MNWQTAIICIVLALIVGLVIFFMIRNKRKGKSSCGCGCSECALKDKCHPKKH
ncbi:MAG: FeoB-associated Cys-rich membrane protein [Eubacteriales bacterium]